MLAVGVRRRRHWSVPVGCRCRRCRFDGGQPRLVHIGKPFVEGDHLRRHVELLGQHALHALAHGARGQAGGVAAHKGLAAGGGGPAVGRQVGVHHQHVHAAEGQAQLLGGAGRQHADQVLAHLGAATCELRPCRRHRPRPRPRPYPARRRPAPCSCSRRRCPRRTPWCPMRTRRPQARARACDARCRVAVSLVQAVPSSPAGGDLILDLVQAFQQADAVAQQLAGGGRRAHGHAVDAPQLDRVHAQLVRRGCPCCSRRQRPTA